MSQITMRQMLEATRTDLQSEALPEQPARLAPGQAQIEDQFRRERLRIWPELHGGRCCGL